MKLLVNLGARSILVKDWSTLSEIFTAADKIFPFGEKDDFAIMTVNDMNDYGPGEEIDINNLTLSKYPWYEEVPNPAYDARTTNVTGSELIHTVNYRLKDTGTYVIIV